MPYKFDFGKFNSTVVSNDLVEEQTTRVNTLPLANIKNIGLQMKDFVTFNFKDTNATVPNMEFLAVSQIIDAVQGTDYDFYDIEAGGLLGLAPYYLYPLYKERNFLWNLKQLGVIDHMTFSIYLRPEAGNSSCIKFGSFDTEGLTEGTQLKIIRTIGINSWALFVKNIVLGEI